MKFFFVDFLSGFAGIFIPVRQKKSLKISFFMEKGMVCEKEKLAGMTGERAETLARRPPVRYPCRAANGEAPEDPMTLPRPLREAHAGECGMRAGDTGAHQDHTGSRLPTVPLESRRDGHGRSVDSLPSSARPPRHRPVHRCSRATLSGRVGGSVLAGDRQPAGVLAVEPLSPAA